MIKDKRLKLFIWCYPIALTFIGVIIHAVGLFGFQVYLTSDFILHLVMLLTDSLVVIGLYRQKWWGYWLAVMLYCQQSICQPYWAYKNFTEISNSLPHFVSIILILISLFVLLRFKKSFFYVHEYN